MGTQVSYKKSVYEKVLMRKNILGQKNKAVNTAHRVTKINLMRAVAKKIIGKYIEKNIVKNS